MGPIAKYPALGNHDCFSSYVEPWHEFFHTLANNSESDETYYSFDVGDARVAVVNANGESAILRQLEWLRSDLGTCTAMWRMIITRSGRSARIRTTSGPGARSR